MIGCWKEVAYGAWMTRPEEGFARRGIESGRFDPARNPHFASASISVIPNLKARCPVVCPARASVAPNALLMRVEIRHGLEKRECH